MEGLGILTENPVVIAGPRAQALTTDLRSMKQE
jgi:hypothetical protein